MTEHLPRLANIAGRAHLLVGDGAIDVELRSEKNPAIADSEVVEATIHLKGVTLRAQDRARDMRQAVNLCEEELSRQVKRHREKRRGRRKVGTETIRTSPPEAFGEGVSPAS